jgi:hypothetical protein
MLVCGNRGEMKHEQLTVADVLLFDAIQDRKKELIKNILNFVFVLTGIGILIVLIMGLFFLVNNARERSYCTIKSVPCESKDIK